MTDDVVDRATVVGRDSVVERLVRSRAPLTLLTGDSGIGKSEVLRLAQLNTTTALAPPPHSLPSSGGVLQRVLLDTLGEALAEDIHLRGRAREAAQYLVEAAQRMARDRGQELVKVIAREALSIVRGRLGPDVGSAIAEYWQSLTEAVDERLEFGLNLSGEPPTRAQMLDVARRRPPALTNSWPTPGRSIRAASRRAA